MRKLKDESVAMHQKSKNEFNQAHNDVKRELAQTRKERDSLEVRLKQLLHENHNLEEKVNKKTEKNNLKESMQLQSFREENEALKRQMFSIDKQYRQVESALADAHDTNERINRELEQVRKKFNEAN